jgi:2-succinyl-5-enolpyruvyl-6-hydroxy-3-cyclohexene-1-carboxylate synthase
MNINLARKILTTTKEAGVHEYIVCAGARNSPLVFQLAKSNGARIFHFFEERSAGFFALGRMKCTGKPVAVVTTSGTAVAELLPATIEAHYSQLPLVIISADRPRNYRNTGAPQSIEQLGLFSHYVEKSVDVESTDESADLDMWSGLKPIHINVCFDEPLIDGEIVDIDLSPAQIKNFNPLRSPHGKRIIKPAVIVGGLKKDETIKVVNFLKAKKIPVYAEVNSQIFGQPEISFISERTLEILVSQQKVKSLIRIGSIPTLRLWRDLESKYNLLPVYSCSEIEYTGLSRSSHFILGLNHLENLIIEEFQDVEISEFIQISNKKTNLISELLKKISSK